MIDNFELIKEFIKNNYILNKGDFFLLQILKRRKENPDMKKDVSSIDSFIIINPEDLDYYKEDIIKLCQEHNARAYFRLNKRNEDKIALQTLKISTDDLIDRIHPKYNELFEEYCKKNNINKNVLTETGKKITIINMITECLLECDWFNDMVRFQFLSAAGQFASDPVKKWVIDVDDPSILEDVKQFLETITDVFGIIPTKNGFHIITKGFNPQLLDKKFNKVEIKKDSPTILYCI
jgi:hypothetical protein